jgi:murein DD-endopeptidase MepM/ murein hydrolase activator NlpD
MQGFGRRVKIESADGKTRSVYAHLSYINVTVGQKVEDGFIVGLAGRSGNVGNDESKVPTHLHCEIQEGDGHGAWTPRDPGKWMMGVDT